MIQDINTLKSNELYNEIVQRAIKYLICGGGVCEGAGLYKLRFELAAILDQNSRPIRTQATGSDF